MKVILAGLNIDVEVIAEARGLLQSAAAGRLSGEEERRLREFLAAAVWSPESISAAYARISRDPAEAPVLRARSRSEVAAARRSNRRIIFGLGHSSVAEHAVFNFDILGVSRLAMEEIEHHRLCSYTEKSQRYITLDEEMVVPREVADAGLEAAFTSVMRKQFADYRHLFSRLRKHTESRGVDAALGDQKVPEGVAKEDARYVLCLAVPGQLGMTANARNVERIAGRLGAHPLGELREFARRLEGAVEGVAPSLIKYTDAAGHSRMTEEDLSALAGPISPGSSVRTGDSSGGAVKLVSCPEDGDSQIAEALLFASSGRSLGDCRRLLRSVPRRRIEELLRAGLRRLRCWDPVHRAFECAAVAFELIVSASCFAQLKRHRMATVIPQAYDLSLGVSVPQAVIDAGQEERFREAIERTEELYSALKEREPRAADYALTNAHRRRVYFGCNLRELYHFARLRMDAHAQWEIRSLAGQMVRLVRERMPLASLMLTGKDGFDSLKRRLFGEQD